MNLIEQIRKRHMLNDDANVGIRQGPLAEVKAVEEANRNGRLLITAVATTATVDLDAEVVVPGGADLAYFRRFKAVYFNHDSRMPIAALRSLAVLPNSAGWRVQASTIDTQLARDVSIAIQEGAINGGSIGFRRKNSGNPTPQELDLYGPHEFITREWDWLEWSVTPMPCNPDAVIEAVEAGKALPLDDAAALAIDRLAVKGRITRESARIMGVPKRRLVVIPERKKLVVTA